MIKLQKKMESLKTIAFLLQRTPSNFRLFLIYVLNGFIVRTVQNCRKLKYSLVCWIDLHNIIHITELFFLNLKLSQSQDFTTIFKKISACIFLSFRANLLCTFSLHGPCTYSNILNFRLIC